MTNNNTNKGFTMKSFDITYIDPWTNRQVNHREVPASQLKDIDGETWYTGYNDPIEVITATLVPESRLAAQAAYFARWGTASE